MSGRNPRSAETVLAAYAKLANSDGEFDLNAAGMAERLGCGYDNIQRIASRLCEAGSLDRITRGRYRITGMPYVATPAGTHAREPYQTLKPTPMPVRESPPCTYRGARSMGIEPVVRLIVNSTMLNSGSPVIVAVSLARVPCVDGPAP